MVLSGVSAGHIVHLRLAGVGWAALLTLDELSSTLGDCPARGWPSCTWSPIPETKLDWATLHGCNRVTRGEKKYARSPEA